MATDQPITAESLGWQLRAILPPLALQSVSLHDQQAELLWLSEGELGPDDYNLVTDALQALATDRSLPGYESDLGDGRMVIFLPVRTPGGDLLGLAMALADLGDSVLEQLMTPQVRSILRKLSVLMRPALHMNELGEPVVAQAMPPAAPSSPPRQRSGRPSAASRVPPPPQGSEDFAEPVDLDSLLDASPVVRGSPELPPPTRSTAASQSLPSLAARSRRTRVEQRRRLARTGADTGRAHAAYPRANPPTQSEESATLITPRVPTLKASPPGERPPRSSPGTRTPKSSPGTRTRQAPSDFAAEPGYSGAPPVLPAAATSTPSSRGLHPRSQASSRTGAALDGAGAAPASTRVPIPSVFSEAPEHSGLALALPEPPSGPSYDATPVRGATLLLEILPYVKLRPGRNRRYEVLPRTSQRDTSRAAATLDASAVQQLTGWLGAHRAAWSLEPTSFTLNLSIDTLEDERFLRDTASSLKAHSLAPDSFGFEIAEALCTQHRAQVERFIASCEQLGCFVAIDDFSFDSAILPLLRSRAVRLVKIDHRLTSAAQRDKLSQATVVAIIQAARVLGIDCAAQSVDSQSTLQWLKSSGCDLAQGPLLAQPQRLDSLG